MQPPPLVAPTYPPYQAPPPFGYTPPNPGTFTGTVPNAKPVSPFGVPAPAASPYGSFSGGTPYGSFTGTAPAPIQTGTFAAPDPLNFQTDPSYQWRFTQGLKGLQAGAAKRGTLLTGGTQKAIEDYGQNAASQEYQNAYRRALDTYTTNRDTNAQNFGQTVTAGNAARADYGTNRDTNAQNFGQAVTTYGTNRDTVAQNAAEQRAAFRDALTGYDTNRDTDALNAKQKMDEYRALLDRYRTNADTTLAAGAQGLSAATAGYDRNAAAGRTAFEDTRDQGIRQADVLNANNAMSYQAQLADYDRMRQQEDELYRRNLDASRNQDRPPYLPPVAPSPFTVRRREAR